MGNGILESFILIDYTCSVVNEIPSVIYFFEINEFQVSTILSNSFQNLDEFLEK